MTISRLRGRPIALSLTGSGHLLVYQLGVCNVHLQKTRIEHVSGCSGGAIVAALIWQLPYPEMLAEYANEFIKSRGDGISSLRKKINLPRPHSIQKSCNPKLSICTTRCRDGELCKFDFQQSKDDKMPEELFWRVLEASCRIPLSFHPYDMLSKSSYPNEEGIEIEKEYHVDGGISAPAPPNPPHLRQVIISPVAGPHDPWRISPSVNNLMIPSLKLGNLEVVPTLGNLRALRAYIGLTTSTELREWYERGKIDADDFVRCNEDLLFEKEC